MLLLAALLLDRVRFVGDQRRGPDQVRRGAAGRHRGRVRTVQLPRPGHRATRRLRRRRSPAVAEKLGVNVEFVETPWDSIFAALEANRFDVVANEVTITPNGRQKYDLSEPYSVGEGVIVTRADDNSDHVARRPARARSPARPSPATGPRSPATPVRRWRPVEGFTQAITLLNQGRVDVVINDSIAVYAYLAETDDKSVKIAAHDRREERAGLRRPQEQRAAARTEQGARRTACRRHAGDDLGEVPQGQRLRCARAPAAQPAPRSTWQLILRQPVAAGQGRDHHDHPADDHQLRRSAW